MEGIIALIAQRATHNEKTFGNDTIDRYPLCASGILKILCITPAIGSEIYKAFESFRRLFKQPVPRKARAKEPEQKPKKVLSQDVYEPTNAIACNDADWRRWTRVKEWFNDHPVPENFNLEKEKGHIIELLKS